MLPCSLRLAASLAELTATSTFADKEDKIDGRAGGGVKTLLLIEESDLLASDARLAPLAPAAEVRLTADAERAEGYIPAVS